MEQVGPRGASVPGGRSAADGRDAFVPSVPASRPAPEADPGNGPGAPYGGGKGDSAVRGRPTAGEHGSPEEREVRGEHTHGEALPPGPPHTPPLPRRGTVVRSSVRGQVLEALRGALAAGRLEPGKVYSAPALGDRLGVSATPVREAMQQLAAEGAVEVVPNRGFRVVRRGRRELTQLAEVRALVEVPVMLRLAGTVPAERWAELRSLARATVEAAESGSRVAYAEADRAFHREVLRMSGNDQLVRVAEDLHRRLHWASAGPPEPGDHPEDRPDPLSDAQEHLALVDAVTAGDAAAAQELIRAHFAGPHGHRV